MTQREKIEILKSTIIFLYEKEGRSKVYISKLLEVDRKTLTYAIKDWGLVQANVYRMKPSNQKFANKNRSFIKSRIDKDIPRTKIAEELNVTCHYLTNIIEHDEVLKKSNDDYLNRIKINAHNRRNELMNKTNRNYSFEDLEGEEWKEILGYENFYVSNMGRIKKYVPSYKTCYLLNPYVNERCMGRHYISIGKKTLQIARLVGFAFVEGYSNEKNTIDHLDGDCSNNKQTNLEWVSQSENNKRAYERGRRKNIAYSRNKKFKKIVVDGTYEFKTITAMAKFLGVSHTQAQRYISKECYCPREIEFVY